MSDLVPSDFSTTGGGALTRDAGRPLYEQVKHLIAAMVETGVLKPGDRLPSTQQLCGRFGVSHITVTKALQELAREGIISRTQGKGTFVSSRPIERRLTNLVSFTREMARQGLVVRSRVLGVRDLTGTPDLNRRFGHPADAPMRYVEIKRLRFVAAMPACLATSIFPAAIGRRLADLPLEDASFYDLLERVFGLRLLREERWITPIVATEALAWLLEVRRGAPLFRLEGNTFLEGDVPIEATDSIFRGDRFRFVANLFRYVGDQQREDATDVVVQAQRGRGKAR
jgi:GntR family transcriptional regulator